MNLPIRVRLTAWYAALLAVIIAALGAFLVLQLRADLRQTVDDEVHTNSATLIRAVADGDETDAPTPADAAEDVEDFQDEAGTILPHSEGAAQVLDEHGQVLMRYGAAAGAGPLVGAAVRDAAGSGTPDMFTTRLGDGQRYRVGVTAFEERGQTRVLVVAESLRRVEDAVWRVVVLLLVAGPVALAGTTLAAYWLARKALRPVRRMASDAQEIGMDRLHERVAVPASADEIGRLAVTLNAMLERIEHGVTEKHRLIADTSHGLRTPLAVMRAEIDVSLRSDELSPAAREVLVSTREEVDRMSRTVDNLLTLAEADEGRLELLTVAVGLRRAIEDAAGPLRPLAAAKGVSLLVDGDEWEAQADPHRLSLALTNLIENAIKFTPPGGTVHVASWQRAGEVGVTVADDGPGIPVRDREHLFDRFYRVDSDPGRATGGSGLGLAICREVALAHGGRVWVESEPGEGSRFALALPSWRALPAGSPSPRSPPPPNAGVRE